MKAFPLEELQEPGVIVTFMLQFKCGLIFELGRWTSQKVRVSKVLDPLGGKSHFGNVPGSAVLDLICLGFLYGELNLSGE
eukprot:1463485-Amphidinium_carterae.1